MKIIIATDDGIVIEQLVVEQTAEQLQQFPLARAELTTSIIEALARGERMIETAKRLDSTM